MWDMTSRQQ